MLVRANMASQHKQADLQVVPLLVIALYFVTICRFHGNFPHLELVCLQDPLSSTRRGPGASQSRHCHLGIERSAPVLALPLALGAPISASHG